MRDQRRGLQAVAWILLLMGTAGCQIVPQPAALPATTPAAAPRELDKAILPSYVIEPPDVLLIDTVHLVPKSPYRLRTLDALAIQVEGTLAEAPLHGVFEIQPGGTINLGGTYGSLAVAGKTIEEVQLALEEHLQKHLKKPEVSVQLAGMAAQQQIAGEHLVAPDGTVTLGSYGSVSVVGMTVAEAKETIEEHLSTSLEEPEISLDVFGYNSKVYYVITQGAGTGDGVFRFPVTGNETVLDAISQINGLEQVSSKRLWIARAGRNCQGEIQVLPIDWNAITQYGGVETNYQILPGDRIYIAEDKLIALDNSLAKIIAPLERVMGFTLLGTGTATRLSGPVLRGGGNRTNNF
ncbi:MAG: polysaccharide biosynthesis/export family protein [Pirellulales bacterium]|nr:polysaccharide biosynthesis/export family protein [Pirellulales bacterium]